jgi:hypothetical protein
MVLVHFIAIGEAVAIGIGVGGIGAEVEFLKVGEPIAVGVFVREIGVGGVEPVLEDPGNRDAADIGAAQ